MTDIAMARRRVEDAGSLAALLGAAYAAFEEMMAAIYADEDRVGGSFAGFAFASAAAADGRDAVAGAPSLPRPAVAERQAGSQPPDPCNATGELVVTLAGLAELLAVRLGEAAATAGPEDRVACLIAAVQAREVSVLLGGSAP